MHVVERYDVQGHGAPAHVNPALALCRQIETCPQRGSFRGDQIGVEFLRHTFQPAGNVDRIADRRDADCRSVADGPHDGGADMNADCQPERRPQFVGKLLIELTDTFADRNGCGKRTATGIDQEMSYRFRDVFDQLVRMSDDAIIFQERVTGILDAHLTSVSNQLASVSKVLAALAVILGPLTIVTGAFGMNVLLPIMPGGERAQFWWIVGGMGVITGAAYYAFRRKGWL